MIEIKRKDKALYRISFSEFRKCWTVVCLSSKKVIRCNSVSEAFALCAKRLRAVAEPGMATSEIGISGLGRPTNLAGLTEAGPLTGTRSAAMSR